MKRAGFVVVLIALACAAVLTGTTDALAQSGVARSSHNQPIEHVPPNREETAGIGCMTFGAAAVMAASAVGVAALAASGGAAAAYANLALPVLGTAFAAGCAVGAIAAPGAAWLTDHLEHVIYGVPEQN
jgi:hypothetical protein